uniref:Protein kinase domain-containing protein n=1 Tax=Aplanochytrium stocchinoi TaxID=215587 RepID=A0A7S3LNG8_9STRA|eukprot:CAMPEP_0204871870 /NCGR_PEP_ID=MMETSP1348-20121228/36697_1 /ASSEMBLY_ACC=CAM_ASM_000700 /TAXON_ID=215587 /ORGANISM="Aplanochytrium stocchinoi, Strain GSBS06" /LENGTH=379 /DNA_ID=CAMNT_0052026413 /DNA_START=177 /DNA_END=1316 /DNA_ORIENTATION=-
MGNTVGRNSLKGLPMSDFLQKYKQTDTVLGKGGFGEVKLALDSQGNEYAVKIIEKSVLASNNEKISELYNEVSIIKNLDHQNIVKYHDFYEDKKTVRIVMGAGKADLFEHLCRTEKHTENDCKRIIRKVTEALNHCHENGVVHRDIKPENILVGSAKNFEDVALIDFGLAKAVDIDIEADDAEFEAKGRSRKTTVDTSLLRTKCGTLSYVAPEVIRRNSYTYKCDIWSLGIVAYIVVSGGYHPFASSNTKQTRENVERGLWKFGPDKVWEKVSEEAKDFIRCCLNRDPSKRYTYNQLLQHEWIANPMIFEDRVHRDSRDPISINVKLIQQQLRADLIKGHLTSSEENLSINQPILEIGRPIGTQVTFFDKNGRAALLED